MHKKKREAYLGTLFAMPTWILVLGLFILPLGLAVWMSFNDWPLIGSPEFSGAENYEAMVSNELLIKSIVFTLIYTVTIAIIYLLVGLSLALLVQNSRPGVGVFRTLYLLPTAVGLSSAALLFYSLYTPSFGPVPDLFVSLGLTEEPLNLLSTQEGSFAGAVAMVTWRFAGFNMIILLTGLQAIPLEAIEAARIDGANALQILRRITLPLLKPWILLVLILTVTSGVLVFEPFYVLTAGGPSNSTVTIVMTMVREAFSRFSLGSAAAIAVALLVILLAINAIQAILFRDRASGIKRKAASEV